MRTTMLPDTQAKPEQSRRRPSLTRRQGERHNLRSSLFINIVRLVLLVALLSVWQFLSGRFVDPLFISSPLAVLRQTVARIVDGTLWMHTEITLQETLLGLFFGIISGIAAGFLFGLQPLLAEACDPFVTSIYSIPKIALAPLFILWFGIDIEMKVILASVTVFFLIFFNTLAGVRDVDQWLSDYAACDFAFLIDFYKTGVKKPFKSYWQEKSALLSPKKIPSFTPTRWVGRNSGIVV